MKARELKFGIEIECLVPSELVESGDFRPGPYHHGYRINRSPDGWNSQQDGSLRSHDYNYTPVEVVSPILSGEEGLTEVVYMLAYLNEIGAKVNETCGLHVHVDASHLNVTRLEIVKRLFQSYETAFYGMNGTRAWERWNNGYCAPSPRWNGSRYQSLNLTNIGGPKNTVEFRCFFSTLNDYEVVSIVYMCVALVSRASEAQAIDEVTHNVRYPNPYTASCEFDHRFLSNRLYRIVDDETVSDVSVTMSHLCRQAIGSMRPLLDAIAYMV